MFFGIESMNFLLLRLPCPISPQSLDKIGNSIFNGDYGTFYGVCSHAHQNSDLATIDEGSRGADSPANDHYPRPPPPVISLDNTCLLDSRSSLLLKFIFVALVFLLLSAARVQAATFTANSHATLVSAINSANGNSEADTINITANITLTADLPTITSNITINGNNNTINGADSHRAITIDAAGISVTINNLTLNENQAPAANPGGAIRYRQGSALALNGVTVRDSAAWYSSNTNDGGGLYCNVAGFTISGSAFFNNAGNEGGAIFMTGNCRATINRSAFFNNSARLNGGAFHIGRGAQVTINNTSIYGNKAGDATGISDGRGAAIYIPGTGSGATQRPIRLNHVTITGNRNAEPNQSANDDNEGALHFVLAGVQLHLQNSIIYGNSSERQCSRTLTNVPQLSTNVGNIIGDGNCGTPTGVSGSGGNPQLPSSATSGYYALSQSSPAVDAAACISGLNQDQRGRRRPSGVRCDIGAYEYQYPPPPPPPAPPGSDVGDVGGPGGSSGSASRSGSQGVAQPTAVPVIRYSPEQSCQTLQPDIVVSKASIGTSCQRVEGSEIGHPDVIAAMPSLVVDLWGWVTPGTQVCFRADSGAIKFIDTTAIPRTVSDLPVFSEAGGLLCATIDGAGQVALVAGPSAPAPQQQAASAQGRMLSDCMVLLQYSLNFRDAPDGKKIGALRSQIKLTALERTDGWFKVDYHGEQGWISAAYVEPEGDCG